MDKMKLCFSSVIVPEKLFQQIESDESVCVCLLYTVYCERFNGRLFNEIQFNFVVIDVESKVCYSNATRLN